MSREIARRADAVAVKINALHEEFIGAARRTLYLGHRLRLVVRIVAGR
jgi:hypothetical protein